MLKGNRKVSVFFRWLASYLVMLVLMLLASVGLYFFSYGIISSQQEKVNKLMLEKIQIEVDDYYNSAKATLISLLLDPEVEEIMKKEGVSLEDRSLIYNVYGILRNKMVASDNIDRIFLYFMHGDTVLSTDGHIDKELFYELYYKNDKLTGDAFDDLMEQIWCGSIIDVPNCKDQRELIFLRNSMPRGDHDMHATIGISISSDKVIGWIEEQQTIDNTEVIILDKNNVLCSNGKTYETLFEQYEIETVLKQETKEVSVAGVPYNIISIASDGTGLRYIALSPQADIYYEARQIQLFMIGLLFACLTIGIIVAYLMTRMHYDPLKEVMEAFGYYDNRNTSDEYTWLLEQKNLFHKEHQKAKREINEREHILRLQDLYRLISLPFDNRYQKYAELSNDVLFEKENVLVFLFYLEAIDHESIYANMNRNMSRFVLKNILEELLAGRLTIEIVDMMDHFACIVNTDKKREECREILEEVLDEMQRFMAENMQIQAEFVFGGFKRGMDGVHSSYILAREASEYKKVMSGTQFIWFDDIKSKHTIYHYPAEIEQKIINAISICNREDVCKWINEIIDINYQKRDITQHMKKCLVADMCGTLIKAGEQAGSVDFLLCWMDENPILDEWTGHWDVAVLRDYMQRMVYALCDDISKSETVKRDDKQFGWQVMEYVKQNYNNPDLNISITALHFGITPSYLSALFKEQTGLNLLEYINHIRIEQVKMLLEEDYSLVEICDKTGFRSSGALIRVFKKETGVTPGQMKKILGKTSKE